MYEHLTPREVLDQMAYLQAKARLQEDAYEEHDVDVDTGAAGREGPMKQPEPWSGRGAAARAGGASPGGASTPSPSGAGTPSTGSRMSGGSEGSSTRFVWPRAQEGREE